MTKDSHNKDLKEFNDYNIDINNKDFHRDFNRIGSLKKNDEKSYDRIKKESHRGTYSFIGGQNSSNNHTSSLDAKKIDFMNLKQYILKEMSG